MAEKDTDVGKGSDDPLTELLRGAMAGDEEAMKALQILNNMQEAASHTLQTQFELEATIAKIACGTPETKPDHS